LSFRSFSVDVLAVADPDDQNEKHFVPDLVDDPIVTCPDTIEFFFRGKSSGFFGIGIYRQGRYF